MIGKLSGLIDCASGSQLVIDVNGVGYVVSVSSRTMAEVGHTGEAATLWIETHVREDAINLYGFGSLAERDAFRLLTTVQGVGAKSALSLLGILSPERLAHAIASGDKAALGKADGVGPKLALRIVTELKDKAPLLGASFTIASTTSSASSATGKANANTPNAAAATPANNIIEDALSALVHLGYKRMEAYAALVACLPRLGEAPKLDELIRAGLSELSGKGAI